MANDENQDDTPKPDPYLSPKDIARLLNCSRQRAYDIVHQCPHLRSPLRVAPEDFEAWVRANTVHPKPAPPRLVRAVEQRKVSRGGRGSRQIKPTQPGKGRTKK